MSCPSGKQKPGVNDCAFSPGRTIVISAEITLIPHDFNKIFLKLKENGEQMENRLFWLPILL